MNISRLLKLAGLNEAVRFSPNEPIYFEVGDEVTQNAYPGCPAKVIEVFDDEYLGKREPHYYRIEIDTTNEPEATDENGDHENVKYCTMGMAQLTKNNPNPKGLKMMYDPDDEHFKNHNGFNEAKESKCLTPDSIYKIQTSPSGVSASVKFPNEVDLPEDEAKQLELNIHNALELALAAFLKNIQH